jgi:hypothetical protein
MSKRKSRRRLNVSVRQKRNIVARLTQELHHSKVAPAVVAQAVPLFAIIMGGEKEKPRV